ncbi:AsmA-like C-terminal domain-containing protein [Thalassospira lucentensis]|uniref:YhdP family protein n=1 Tax=Thalassospira lucentensis TaxID=168935 RepID=UPI003AA7EDD3
MRLIKTFSGWLGLFFGAIVLFVGVFGAVTIWRVAQGPVSLHRITPYIVDHLNESMGENRLSVGDLVLSWRGWDEKFDVRLRDVSVLGPDNSELLHVPEADVVFSTKALFEGVLALRQLNLIGPRIRLERGRDGKINVGYAMDDIASTDAETSSDDNSTADDKTSGDSAQTTDGVPSVSIDLPPVPENDPVVDPATGPAMENVSDKPDNSAGTEHSGSTALHDIVDILSGARTDFPAADYFESFGVVNADLEVVDEKLDVVWAAPQADILLTRGKFGVTAQAFMQVSAGRVETHVDLTGDYSNRTGEIDLTANIGKIELSDLPTISTAFDALRDAYLPVSGALKATVGADGEVITASADLAVGSGVLSLPEEIHATYRVTDGRIAASYVPGRFSLDDVTLNVGDSSANLKGVVLDPFADWKVNFDVSATDVKTNDLNRLWPENVGYDARKWVVENLSEGGVHQATMHAELHKDAAGEVAIDALGGQMTMSGVTVHYLGDMPVVLDAAGRAEFDADSFKIYADKGHTDGLIVDKASIEFTELNAPRPSTDIEVVAHGSVQKALELIDAEPLGFAKRLGIDPKQISGDQATRVKLYFPLIRAVTFDDVEVAAATRIENAKVTNAFRDLDIADGAFELQVNTKGLELNGDAAIEKGRTNIKWIESFDEQAAQRSHYTLWGDLDLTALRRVDLDVAPYLTGVAKGTLDIKVGKKNVGVTGDLNLDQVAMSLAAADYQKPKNVQAKAEFDLVVAGDNSGTIKSFRISAPELSAIGKADWAGGNAMSDVWSAQLASAGFRQSRGISGSVRLGQDQRLIVDLTGKQFDLRPFVEDVQSDAAAPATENTLNQNLAVTLSGDSFLIKGDEPTLNVGKIVLNKIGANQEVDIEAEQAILTPWLVSDDSDKQNKQVGRNPNSGGIGEKASRAGGKTDIFLNVDQVVMANGELINKFDGAIHMIGDEWDGIVLNGTLGDRSNVFAQVERQGPKTRKVRLTSDDAGRFLRAVDMYDNVLGGKMTIEGTVNEAKEMQPFTGTVKIGAFRVVNAPIAARVLGAASLTGLGDVLSGNGIAFDELNGDFTYVNDVVTLGKVAANGSAIGVTANGSIDLAKSEIRLSGSIVPIYALNSALGVIPILGDLLVGEEGGGVFAPTYTIEGDLSDPDVTVNPLSTFIPGIFRNLITGAEPG